MGLSAVCAYSLATVEAVFSRGKYMQSATVEQSHTKWVRYNGPVPTPRPGAVSRVPGSREGLSSPWVSVPKRETADSQASLKLVAWQQEPLHWAEWLLGLGVKSEVCSFLISST